MDKLTNIKFIRDLLSGFGFTFSKQMGQNFLINPSVCPRMAQLCGCENIGVLEIGPGIGVLTKELAKLAAQVVAVELDERLRPVLDVTLKDCQNVQIRFGDILKLDLKELFDSFAGMDVVVCANLPYYITSPVIMRLLESRLPFRSITVMVQKEAAARLCAKPGTRACGAVTLAVQYYATAQKCFDVDRGSFLPAPNVDSSVIRLDIRQSPAVQVQNEVFFFKVIKAAFGQRRKTLPNALSAGLGLEKPIISDALSACGVRPAARAEELDLEAFASVADALLQLQ